MDRPILIPGPEGETEYVEKRSRFLGHVKHVTTEDEARDFIAGMKKKYHDARHNCWCYIVPGAERYSDDGEPQGTAGIPMLEVFRKAGVGEVVCVVTRYFGGVLLGTGGLLRAYTKAAKDALSAAGIVEVIPEICVHLDCPYSLLELVKQDIADCQGRFEAEYGQCVGLNVTLPEGMLDLFSGKIAARNMVLSSL